MALKSLGAALGWGILIVGCSQSGGQSGSQSALGAQAAAVVMDTHVVGAAEGAVGEVVRNAQDCEFVRSNLPAAKQALQDAMGKIQTATGRQSLDGLSKQLSTIEEACVGVSSY